ncbi:exodeoxyribonuclease III [Zophobihabitans entericus]|uniref:Exodeoxyribonuclease III n=1 Tax=Zophobihabitans entericus TaxID=1635327 RepID=A0A6G9I8X1_9GAMM|nr:exodeoxyribonuclease III [Zophobihabitans entericus]QIQ20663.1 exodeoxyribonuclease III [Zophobihabitans entericus]
MKFISFNINGLRARQHQLAALIEKHNPDVIGLQETKVHDEQFPLEEMQQFGYHLNYYGQKAHYGVALLTKQAPIIVQKGFPTDDEEAQRRLIIADLPTSQGKLTVINGYFPQGESLDHPIKFPAKRKFYADLHHYLQTHYSADDKVLVMGDMNISPTDLDIGLPEESKKRWLKTGKTSFLPEEREWMDQLLGLGFIDTFREANPTTGGQYSWFDYRSKGFDTNTGLRIDLILASQKLASTCIDTGIDYQLRAIDKPSDHAPIWAEFKL